MDGYAVGIANADDPRDTGEDKGMAMERSRKSAIEPPIEPPYETPGAYVPTAPYEPP
jgi:hypothetical protein